MKSMPHHHIEGTPRVHLVGVGGIGVSALAELLHARGATVTGTDRAESARIQDLRLQGIDVRVGDDPALAEGADLVVYTSAAKVDHPERRAAEARGVPQFPRGAALAALVGERRGVGVAGAHGKTSTTALLAEMLAACGADPGAAVGGVVEAWGSPVRPGQGELFVAEADESDRSFLALPLALALALNIDRDHLENYRDFEELVGCYRQYLEAAREGAVVFLDDPQLRALVETWAGDGPPPVTVSAAGPADLELREITSGGGGVSFEARWRGQDLGAFRLPRPGVHGAWNAGCALAAGLVLGQDPEALRTGMAGSRGVDRRFTFKGEVRGVRLHDDYAHMPVEVAATIRAARSAYPERRLVAVFQPHLYSRTRDHAAAFGAALAEADRAFVLPVYGAREQPLEGVDAALVAAAAPGHVTALDRESLDAAAAELAPGLDPGDVVLTLGAGSVTALGPALRRALAGRGLAAALERLGLEHTLDARLARYNSFQCGGAALAVVRPADEAALARLLPVLHDELQLPFKVLGGGTNVLVSDAGYEGVVVLLGEGFQGFELEGAGEDPGSDRITFRAGAALTTGKLFRRLQKAGVGGFEWFHHVPGTLGGAIVNNSSAYGQSLEGHLVELKVMDASGQASWRPAASLEARYRWTRLKGCEGQVVLGARLEGPRTDPAVILAEARRQAAQRNATQPGGKGSVGCAFKNPEGRSAGQLIEAAGLKGRRVGGAVVSEKHGNFLLNSGAATASDIVALAELVRRQVRARFGVELEYEIERIGEFPHGA